MCYNCRQHFFPLRPSQAVSHVSEVMALAYYEGVVRDALHRLKYSRSPDLARQLGILSSQVWSGDISRYDFVTSVPMHRDRYIQRGYNQAELVAREIARTADLPYVSYLTRERDTPPQHSLSHYRRRQNVEDAFSAACPIPHGVRILLVDDILTTGSTVASCAGVLKRGGARDIGVLVIAYAEL
ncbi:MAG TPA: ComF family protein [Bacillota bacterium]|nr:ComF family protein [Bacillota bacterium]